MKSNFNAMKEENELNLFDITDDIASMSLLFEQVVNHKGLPGIEKAEREHPLNVAMGPHKIEVVKKQTATSESPSK